MKRLVGIILFVLIVFSGSVYPFWIWSPKAKKWRNPQYSPLASPQAQLQRAMEAYKLKAYKDALVEFRKLVIHFPDSKEAPEAQFYVGACLEGIDKPYQAFKEYQKVVDSYPYSERIDEIVAAEYRIGDYFLNRKRQKWLGLVLDELFEHPSIEIFKKVIDNAPYSESAQAARYKLGLLHKNLGRYEESIAVFEELVEKYPESRWAEPARYQLAFVSAEASLNSEYDQELTKEAEERFKDFAAKHPDAEISREAHEELVKLRNKGAEKYFNIGEFYYKQNDYRSAGVYYTYVRTNFPKTSWAQEAEKKIEEIKEKQR